MCVERRTTTYHVSGKSWNKCKLEMQSATLREELKKSSLVNMHRRSTTEGTALSSHLDNLQNLTIYWVFPNQKQTLGGGVHFGGSVYVRSSNIKYTLLAVAYISAYSVWAYAAINR